MKKKNKSLLDLNNLPSLTQKDLDEYESERLRLEEETREYCVSHEQMTNTNIIFFNYEKKKRCKKERS